MSSELMLHEQLEEMDLHGLSKCAVLRELSGVSHCHEFGGYRAVKTPCKECREKQKAALIKRIREEYGVL